MAPTIDNKELQQFADDYVNLKRDDLRKYRDQIDNMREQLAKKIATEPGFALKRMRHAGSVRKGTALKRTFDMDVVVYVEKEDAPTQEHELLQWLRDRLREVYPTKDASDFEVKTHAVTVSFRGTGLDVDVVPVLQDASDSDYGEMVTRYNQRVRTNVKGQLDYLRAAVQGHSNAKQLIRFIKRWRDQEKDRSDRFKLPSFVIELVVVDLIKKGLPTNDLRVAIEKVFSYLSGPEFGTPIDSGHPGAVRQHLGPWVVLDPVAPENNIATRMSLDHVGYVRERAGAAFDAIMDAASNPMKGEVRDAWTEVMGGRFA